MQNQKHESLLNLALGATPEGRERSENLDVGYDPLKRTWELIVRYPGSLADLTQEGIQVNELLNGYTILVVPEYLMGQISDLNQIKYIEKPKGLFFASNMAKATSCLSVVQPPIGGGGGGVTSGLASGLTGKEVLVVVIGSGIDYFHENFKNADGGTRILMLIDQDRDRIYIREEINQALNAPNRAASLAIVPPVDLSGYGAAVAVIAVENGRGDGGIRWGAVYKSDLLVVKLGVPMADNFSRTTQLVRGLDFVIRQAQELGRPVVVNLSFGNTYGSHDGASLLEIFMNDISNYGRSVLIAGTGNEGAGADHTSGQLVMGNDINVELSIASFKTGMGVQLWSSCVDQLVICLITPFGSIIDPIDSRLGPQTLNYGRTRILFYYGKPSSYSPAQEIYSDFIPIRDHLNSGVQAFRLTPEWIVTGQYNMQLPSRDILNPSIRSLRAVLEITLTIPSAAAKVISVGTYDDSYRAYVDFSGRGFIRQTRQVKPGLAAPGVDIITARNGEGYEAVTGTSPAVPFVTGSAALLMQWGIVEGNDLFLYDEKVKAFLAREARHLSGYGVQPNPQPRYGALCVRDDLPI